MKRVNLEVTQILLYKSTIESNLVKIGSTQQLNIAILITKFSQQVLKTIAHTL